MSDRGVYRGKCGRGKGNWSSNGKEGEGMREKEIDRLRNDITPLSS
jgi:hypothetical protein